MVHVANLRKIGFNDHVEHAGRKFMVQTEVLVVGAPVVRTTILERGVVRFTDSQPLPTDAAEVTLQQIANSQHQRALHKIKQSGVQ